MIWSSYVPSHAPSPCCTRAGWCRREASIKCRPIQKSSRSTWVSNLVEIQGLNQYYGGSHTLWDVDLSVPTGSCTCLMGRNGMGKTTLLKCIMGLLPVRSGQILFGGKDLKPLPAEARAPLRIGYVPQGRLIFSQLTVEENLRTGLAIRKLKSIPEHIFAM